MEIKNEATITRITLKRVYAFYVIGYRKTFRQVNELYHYGNAAITLFHLMFHWNCSFSHSLGTSL